MNSHLKLPALALKEAVLKACLDYTQETDQEISDILVKSFRVEGKIVDYDIKFKELI